jgi:hypothetical protein
MSGMIHHKNLIFGCAFLALAVMETLSGQALGRFGVGVTRADNPKTFWRMVGFLYLFSLICFGLYLYTGH